MKTTDCFAVVTAAVFSIAVAATASARSLLYYYDFDTVDADGNLVVSGVNKGTGNLAPSVGAKENDGDTIAGQESRRRL